MEWTRKTLYPTLARIALVSALAMLCACSSIGYYGQAIAGHWSVMSRTSALSDVLADPQVDENLKRKLRLVATARDFASESLGLPDNESYRRYADLERPYVVWNVFAAPTLSLDPVESCFLFVGCLSYRGFFDETEARAFGAELHRRGNDVFVAGVAAYSTLGWFDDPVLNTMLRWHDERIIEVIFHELAHQLIYVRGDTIFNESFATALAQYGVATYLAAETATTNSDKTNFVERDDREVAFYALLFRYRDKLQALYKGNTTATHKSAMKTELFRQLLEEYEALKAQWGGYDAYDTWMQNDLNNAKLSSVATYHHFVPAFRVLLEIAAFDLARFYAAVRRLGQREIGDRHACLADMLAMRGCADGLLK